LAAYTQPVSPESKVAEGGQNVSGSAAQVETVVILLAVTLIVALISRVFHLVYTLVLVMVGLVIGLLPILAHVHLAPDMVLFLFLPVLMFEGAWNVDVEKLRADWLPVFLLAVPGLGVSLVLVAAAVHWGLGLPWLLALLLGAMVSPTDPVAVLALLRQLGMAERLRTIVEGESLFNDGVGAAFYEIVLLLLLPSLGVAAVGSTTAWRAIVIEAAWLLVGGPAIGLVVGWVIARLVRLVDDSLIAMSVTFSTAYGVYLLGEALHTSGLLAVVTAGLVIGSSGRRTGRSEHTQEAVHAVWEFIGYLANSLAVSVAWHRNWRQEPAPIFPPWDRVGSGRRGGRSGGDSLHVCAVAPGSCPQGGAPSGRHAALFACATPAPSVLASADRPLGSARRPVHCLDAQPARHSPAAHHPHRYCVRCGPGDAAWTRHWTPGAAAALAEGKCALSRVNTSAAHPSHCTRPKPNT